MTISDKREGVKNKGHFAACFFLLILVGLVALPHLSGDLVFIGDSDRLNTFLSIKLAEVISLKEHGGISAWNPNSFMGFNMDGLYWTFPGWQPDILVHALFPEADFVRNAGYVTFALLLLAISLAYLYIHAVVGMRMASIAGSCCYGFSALSIGRLSQVDTAYYTIALLPLGMLAIHELNGARWRTWGAVLAACIAVMFGMAFLQESAYVLLLMTAYAVHVSWSSGSRRPIAVFAVALLSALLVAAPRVYGVAEEFSLMFRTTTASGTPAIEILRLLNDGIFGRNFQEAWEVIGNVGFNGHEGLQLYSSTIATCMLFLILYTVDAKRHFGPLLVFMVVCGLIVFYGSRLLGLVAFIAIGFLAVRFLVSTNRRVIVEIDAVSEFRFHLLALSVVLAIVLVPPARAILHLLFFKIDFLHARAVVASLLPFAVVVALVLAGIGRRGANSGPVSGWTFVLMACVGVGAILALQSLVGGWEEGWSSAERRVPFRSMAMNKAVLIQAVLISVATVVAILLLAGKVAGGGKAGTLLYIVLASAIVTEGLTHARPRMFGEHTQTFPTAFRAGNYLSAPRDSFVVPSAECRDRLEKRLDAGQFRSVTISDPSQYFAFTGPFLSQFWQQRFLDGYPGLPKSLAELPWPPGIVTLRALNFRDARDLPWDMLAILGVKYAVPVSNGLYYNRPDGPQNSSPCGFEAGPPPLENPFPPIPRQFFAGSARQSGPKDSLEMSVFGLRAHAVGMNVAEITWDSVLRDGDLEIEKRELGTTKFKKVVRLSAIDSPAYRVKDLLPGGEYEFRIHKYEARGKPGVYSSPVSLQMPKLNIDAPMFAGVLRVGDRRVDVRWIAPPHALTIRIEARHGVLEGFKTVAEVPASEGVARIKLLEPIEQNALRLLAVLPASVSPHSEVFYMGREVDLLRPALERLFGPNPGRDVLVEGSFNESVYPAEGTISTNYRGDNAQLTFEPLDKERFLVVNEMFHPRWHAFVDGKAAPIFRTNRFMLGIPVPKGATSVYLRFEPVTRQWGAVLCVILGLLALIVGFFGVARFISGVLHQRSDS